MGMVTWINRIQNSLRLSLHGFLVALLLCSSPPYTFRLNVAYIMDGFSGREISNREVTICPILTRDGPIEDKHFPVTLLVNTLRQRRSDIKFSDSDVKRVLLQTGISQEDRDTFFLLLFNGKMIHLQKCDSIWNEIPGDYLLVYNIRNGMSVTTFKKMSQKTVTIEAELWDCSNYEVVWRAIAGGNSTRRDFTDVQLIAAGIGEVISVLPHTIPSYDNSKW